MDRLQILRCATDSGMFWDPSGTPGQAWSAGGTKKMKLDTTALTLSENLVCGTNSITSGDITSSTTVKSAIGTVSAPSFAWGGHVTSGLYWDSTALGPAISRQGTQELTFGSSSATFSEAISVPDGSSLIPSVGWSSDPTLGFRRGGTGSLSLCYGNNDIMTYDYKNGLNSLGLDIETNGGDMGCSTLVAGHINSGPINATTQPMTCGAISCTSVTSSGTMSCGTNSMTCGSLSSGAITSSDTFSNGTNSMTTG